MVRWQSRARQALVIFPIAVLVALASAWCMGISDAARAAQLFLYSSEDVRVEAGEIRRSSPLLMIRGFRMSWSSWTTKARLRMKVRGDASTVDATVLLEREAGRWAVEEAFILDPRGDRRVIPAMKSGDG